MSNNQLKNLSFIASKQDFFDKLPVKPSLPSRIEPIEVITPDEELEVIRDKFKQIGDDAVHKVKNKCKSSAFIRRYASGCVAALYLLTIGGSTFYFVLCADCILLFLFLFACCVN